MSMTINLNSKLPEYIAINLYSTKLARENMRNIEKGEHKCAEHSGLCRNKKMHKERIKGDIKKYKSSKNMYSLN